MRKILIVSVMAFVCACQVGNKDLSSSSQAAKPDKNCPELYNIGTIDLDFNPAFVTMAEYKSETLWGPELEKADLIVSSFFNTHVNPNYNPTAPPSPTNTPYFFFERDLVARIPEVLLTDPADVTSNDVEVLTDQHLPLCSQLPPGQPCTTVFPANTIWPNAAELAPEDVFDFEAVVVPQGFHPALKAGRLSLIDLSHPNPAGFYPEYVIHQSGTDAESNPDRFYHKAIFVDMNSDGRKDIVTVRSGMRVGAASAPPRGELVWFEHPENYDGTQTWSEHKIYAMPFPGTGPDIMLDAADMDGDQVVEIVTTHFFTGEKPDYLPPEVPPPHGKVVLYGVPVGFSDWSGVSSLGPNPPRIHVLANDQGYPFDVEFVDLNHDGFLDILATNHQTTDESTTAGRVFAFEQPSNGDLFNGRDWPVHILKDGIRPYANLMGTPPPGRMAPGSAKTFYMGMNPEYFPMVPYFFFEKPAIVVGGDEAGKVWILRPQSQDPTDWNYDAAVVFDINATYGQGTSQTPNEHGITLSTIGQIGVINGALGGEIYIPVFEAKQIHVFNTYAHPRAHKPRVSCVEQ